MDAVDLAYEHEGAFIRQCSDVQEILDRMAEYRQACRAAVRAGNVKARLRATDLLEQAEDRVTDLKARRMRERQQKTGATQAEARGPHRRVEEERPAAEIGKAPPGESERRLQRMQAELAERRAKAKRAEQALEDSRRRAARAAAVESRLQHAQKELAVERARRRRLEHEHMAAAKVSEGRAGPQCAEAESAVQSPLAKVVDAPRAAGEPQVGVDIVPEPKAPPSATAGPRAHQDGAVHRGADLARYRADRKLTQRALAAQFNVAPGTIAKAETAPEKPLGEALQAAMRRVLE